MNGNRRAVGIVLKLAIGWLAFVGFMAGCEGPKCHPELPRIFTPAPFDPQAPGACDVDPQSKYATYEAELAACQPRLPEMNHSDYAMLAANRAMIELALGDANSTCRDAMNAQAVMTGTVKGEEGKAVAAALADESAKVFKGECYEIAMLNSLVGLCSLQCGDDETAAIAFRRALEADKMSKEDARDDFGLAQWGLGMASLDSDPDAAAMALGRCGYKSAEAVGRENVVVVLLIGREPYKRLWGLYGEQDEFALEPYEPRSAEVLVDGESIGKGFKLIDLLEQSQGVPRSQKDVGQGAKAAGKLALAVVVGALVGSSGQDLVEAAWSVKADTRCCYMLPNEIHVASARMSPGFHTLGVKFFDAAGRELPRYEQVWHYVSAPERGRQYLFVRDEFDRCNVQGPIAFTRVNRVRTDKKSGSTTIRFRAPNLKGAQVGQTVRVCHFYRLTENRWDTNYHWRYAPLAYNNKGQPIGYPGAAWRMQDYEVGLVGEGEITEIQDEHATARMTSLTTEYVPEVDDMVTLAKPTGRLWQQPPCPPAEGFSASATAATEE